MDPNKKDKGLLDENLPGNYPEGEDVFRKGLIASEVDPDDISKSKEPVDMDADEWNEKSVGEDRTGDDLDVPGSEYDDADEAIGREDEENNYYSLGGDNHNDLEEDQGD